MKNYVALQIYIYVSIYDEYAYIYMLYTAFVRDVYITTHMLYAIKRCIFSFLFNINI